MDRLYPQEVDTRSLSPLTLAFVGDGVYGLMVRELLACQANRPNGTLHRLSVSMVRAEAQSAAMDVLLPLLTEEEEAVFRRGRNAHTARPGDRAGGAVRLPLPFRQYRPLPGIVRRHPSAVFR